MAVMHIGKVLRELYLDSGLKMARFAALVNMSEKTIYYHFQQAHINTSIIDAYEAALRKAGRPVDIWALITERRKGRHPALPGASTTAEPPAEYKATPPPAESVADLLRRAARLIDEQDAQAKPKE